MKRLSAFAVALLSSWLIAAINIGYAASPIIINEFRRADGFIDTEYIEFLLTQDQTAAQLESLYFGDSTSATNTKYSIYRLRNLASIATNFKAGTIIVIGGYTPIPTEDAAYNPQPTGTDDDWNIKLKIGGSYIDWLSSSPPLPLSQPGDFAVSDIAWIDNSDTGVSSLDSIAWVKAPDVAGSFSIAAKVSLTPTPDNPGNVEFLRNLAGLNITANYAVNSPGSLGLPNGGDNSFWIYSLRNPPAAAITAADSITAISAVAKGTAAGTGITERGFFWWTDSGFTSGTIPAGSAGAGNFSLMLTNLKPQTTYKVSAYIRIGNQLITSGNFLTFTTTEPRIPTVHTDTVNYSLSSTDLTASGEITDIGSSPVMIYGFVYAEHPYPTVWDMALPFTWDMTLPISSGKPFTGTIRNLSPGKYYIRAYAHNSLGTAYGEEFSVIIRGQNTLPTVDSQTIDMIENTDIIITLSGHDADNDPLTYLISKLPAKGLLYQLGSDDLSRGTAITTVPITLSNPNHKVMYSASGGIGSGLGFGFKANDGLGDSAEASVTINVAARNHAPIIQSQIFSIAENAPKGTIVGIVFAADSDGDILTYSIISGNESGIFAIHPTSGQISIADASKLDAGTVVFTVRVSDTRLSADADMTVAIRNTPTPAILPPPAIFEVPATPPPLIVHFNHAPVIYPDIAHLSLKTADENADNPGMRISDLIDITPDPITDEDLGAVEGIAVIDAESENGIWQYDEHDNGQFTDFPKNISENNSLLLDEELMIRFVPNPGFAGTAKIVFRAWDQTFGENTEHADTRNNGGITAFSKDKGEIAIRINATLPETPMIQEDTEIEETPAIDTEIAELPPMITPSPPMEQPSVITPLPEIEREIPVPETPVVESPPITPENSDSGSGCFITSASE